MSEAVQLKLLENLPAILGAIGLILTAIFTFRNGRKTDTVASKLETNTEATVAIKQSVDGAASQSVERIKSLEEQIKILTQHRAEQRADTAAAMQSGSIQTQRPARIGDTVIKAEIVNKEPVTVKIEEEKP